MYGFQLRGGVAYAATLLGALVLLVITGPLRPTPAWRSTVLLGCAVAALGAAVGVLAWPPESLRSSAEAGRIVAALSWGYAHLAALGVAGALILLGAVELRHCVGRLRDRAESRA
jgi:hypothetical protein